MTRRSTVDWVLGSMAAAEPGIELRFGTRVTGLVADPGDPPRVRGVAAGGAAVPADVVVDASGRRTPVDRWLTTIGARRSRVERAECGLAYFGRQYAVGEGAPGPVTTRLVVGLDEFTAGIWGGDNGTMQMALAPLAVDHRFLPARDPRAFTAVLRTVPYYAAWLEALDPITDVFVMGGLHNTLRRLVVDDRPVVLGLHAVGDAVCTTNPTFGSWTRHGRADRRRSRPHPVRAPGRPASTGAGHGSGRRRPHRPLVRRPGRDGCGPPGGASTHRPGSAAAPGGAV